MIGDPSGRSAERNLLDRDDARGERRRDPRPARAVPRLHARQPAARSWSTTSTGSASWSLIDFLRDIGKHFTIPYMLAKDSVQVRLERGLSFTEFSYMLLQAYDFAHLHRTMGVELQMGGADQWGNITAGPRADPADQRGARASSEGQEPAHGLAYKLLLSPSGTKFGKSETGESVWLDPARTSPYAFYQYWLNTDDRDVGTYLRWFTELRARQIEALESRGRARARGAAGAAGAGARHHGADPRGRGGGAGRRRFRGEVLERGDRRPGGAALAVRIGRRVHVRPGGARRGDGASSSPRRAGRLEGRGAPADRRRRRHGQRGAG